MRLPDVTCASTDVMNKILQQWGLEALSDRFAEHLIDLSVLDYIMDVDIVDLCRDFPIRYRLVLRHNLQSGYHKQLHADEFNKESNSTITPDNEPNLDNNNTDTSDNLTESTNFVSVGTTSANNSFENESGNDMISSRSFELFKQDQFGMSDSDSDSPMDVEEVAEAASDRLIPEKSKALYESSYKKFDEWRTKHGIQAVDERCLLEYFSQEMASQKPSTKWSHFSMLKSTINCNLGINISSFKTLVKFLKSKADGYSPKKSKILTKEQIFKFLKDADDDKYLALKVVLIVGVFGACRREEILKLTLNDVEDNGHSVKITIPNSKTKVSRQFVIGNGSTSDVDVLKLFRLYAQKRPTDTPHSRFFIGYRYGKCTRQAIGINTIAQMPKQIAEILKLPSPQAYTGHCFRRSSASLLADSGVDISVVKLHGGTRHNSYEMGVSPT
ncbi:uncharacterized protein LOC134223803 isoform X2 [Armigeres subalbatus]